MIDPNYFDHEDDRRDLIAGFRNMREVVNRPTFREVVRKAILLGSTLQTETELASAVRSLSTTGYHPAGTCVIDIDGDFEAVFDHQSGRMLMVSGNVNAPIVMMTEKAADMIWGHPSFCHQTSREKQHDRFQDGPYELWRSHHQTVGEIWDHDCVRNPWRAHA